MTVRRTEPAPRPPAGTVLMTGRPKHARNASRMRMHDSWPTTGRGVCGTRVARLVTASEVQRWTFPLCPTCRSFRK